jgi:hypothetical protein
VVDDREPLRHRVGDALVALRAGRVEVAALGGADVPGDALPAPAEVVHAREVDELVVALLVAEVRARLDDPGGVDDERGLAVCLDRLDDPGYAGGHSATPRIP